MKPIPAYTFDDVLISPRYSEVRSRTNVNLSVKLGNLDLELPIVSSNMKTITGAKMAATIAMSGGLGILHRFCTINDNVKMYEDAMKLIVYPDNPDREAIWAENVGVSIGVKDEEKLRFIKLYEAGARVFCIDVAHGHHILVKEMVKWINTFRDSRRDALCPNDGITVIAGNIATAQAYEDLIEWGADIAKVGIGPGCFIAGTMVQTKNGKIPIEKIQNGDKVLTHKGNYKEVIGLTNRNEEHKVFYVNNIVCTSNHEFYVLNKKYKEIATDENLNEYAEWISACELTKDYFLLEVKEG